MIFSKVPVDLFLISILTFTPIVIGNVAWCESQFKASIIYGDDNRREFFEIDNSKIRELAHSTAAILSKNKLSEVSPGKYFQFNGAIFGEQYELCKEESFFTQPSNAFCTGSLIAPNLILTAGHCIGNDYKCEDSWIVFDYLLKQQDEIPLHALQKDVYSCKKIIVSEMTFSGADYAIIELDRPVNGRVPLQLRKNSGPTIGTSLFMLGYPSGLPLKFTTDAHVIDYPMKGYYRAKLDAYGGNSGSPVFDQNTLEIVGVLASGSSDFYWTENNCRLSNRCDDVFCYGESVSVISEMKIPFFSSSLN